MYNHKNGTVLVVAGRMSLAWGVQKWGHDKAHNGMAPSPLSQP